MAMVMTGVPSIVMGLFVYIVWTMRFGYSAFGGALALACLMLPVVIGSTEQMLRLVPEPAARGARTRSAPRKSRTILTVVLPAGAARHRVGLAARGRARRRRDGTAAVRGRCRDAPTTRTSSTEANTALSVQIFGNATSSFVGRTGSRMGRRTDPRDAHLPASR